MKLTGQAWGGYEGYDWRGSGEIDFLLVVMKKPGGAHGRGGGGMKPKQREYATARRTAVSTPPNKHKQAGRKEEN